MVLTERFLGFSEGLGKEEIDWNLIFISDRDKAAEACQMLVDGGFVESLQQIHESYNLFVVLDSKNDIQNPRDLNNLRNLLYFTRRKHADSYRNFLVEKTNRTADKVNSELKVDNTVGAHNYRLP